MPAASPVKLDSQILAGIATKAFFLGLWGLGPAATNLTSLENPYSSIMTNLKDQSQIPSIFYGYTAGARYHLKQVYGSMTLGGYDASRFVPHNITFAFAPTISRELVVGLQSITVSGLNRSLSTPINLLPQPILSFIDSAEPQIWLPTVVCNTIAEIFGLQYDPVTDLYLVDDAKRQALSHQNTTLSFQVAADLTSTGTDSVTIDFPYEAFDLELTTDYPANDTQYTLGRTFLQQAYVIADYERSTFSVHQCIFSENAKQELHSIPPISNTSTPSNGTNNSNQPFSTHHSLLPGIIAAIAIASTIVVFLIAITALRVGRRHDSFPWYKFKAKRAIRTPSPSPKDKSSSLHQDSSQSHPEMEGDVHHRPEMAGDFHLRPEMMAGLERPGELSGDDVLCPGNPQHRSEMMASTRAPEELDAEANRLLELENPSTSRWELSDASTRYELEAHSVTSKPRTPQTREQGTGDQS
ncbi:MAG: hypothetical protein Q9160_001982 [Pyrenula sp. 1 TL-2023]